MAVHFTGPFAPMCEKFVAQRRALGADYSQQEMLLHMFDNFCKAFTVEPFVIDEPLVTAWCQKRPNESCITRYNRIMEVQRFSRFLVDEGYPSFLLDSAPKKNSTHTPYIFTHDEIRRIFAVLDSMDPCAASPTRHIVLPHLYRILYGCGLRISEALMLRISDVNTEQGYIHIKHGKNGRERLVPMAQSLTQRCVAYTQKVLMAKNPNDYYFFHMATLPYSSSNIRKEFRGILWDAGIPYLGKDRGPNLHDLRHTFVCHRLSQWASVGEDLTAMLPILSKYLGHTSVAATAWYLRLTAENYPDVIRVMDKFTTGVFPSGWEVPLDE